MKAYIVVMRKAIAEVEDIIDSVHATGISAAMRLSELDDEDSEEYITGYGDYSGLCTWKTHKAELEVFEMKV